MIRSKNQRLLAGGVFAIIVATLAVWILARRHQSLPYHDSFAFHSAAEWTSFGGNWQLQSGSVVNRSDENGAKLVTGSDQWRNYELQADLKMTGHEGDVGLIVRVNDEEQGPDSYNGYYIGLRSQDSALVIGRADHGWMEGRPVAMAGGVQIGAWYHLRVVIYGCDIGAEATNLATHQTSDAFFEETPCLQSGKIGLRSMATGGAWRNVNVVTTSEYALAAIRTKTSFVSSPMYPLREDDYNNMRRAYFRDTFIAARGYQQSPETGLAQAFLATAPIATMRDSPAPGTTSALLGVVTLTSPLYIQDDSGGIAVKLAAPRDLNLGDEVEAIGSAERHGSALQFLATRMLLRGDRTLVVPLSITSTQAAGGAFDSRLIEVRGTLLEKRNLGGDIELQLSDAEQSFNATGIGDLSLRLFNHLKPGSELRVRGICRTGAGSDSRGGSFTVLLRSLDDVSVISGPPWWSASILPRYVLLAASVFAAGLFLYLRMERSTMRAVLQERERIAYTLHDTLAQSFAGVGFHLQGLRNSIRSGQVEPKAAIEKLDVACDLVTHTHREASAEIAALHPDYTEGTDILTALQRSVQALLEADLPEIELVREGTPRQLSMAVRDALFQIGREALSNILRHADARRICLRLRYEPRRIILEIRDDGRGFCFADHAESFGIRGMRHRALRIRGHLSVVTASATGTLVRAEAPYGLGVELARRLRLGVHRKKSS